MRRPILGSCLAVLLCDLAFASVVRARTATWNGTTSAVDAASRWSPAAVPAGTAFFGTAGVPDVTYTGKTVLGGGTDNHALTLGV